MVRTNSKDLLEVESDMEGDVDDGEVDEKYMKIPFETHPVVRITIGDLSVSCLNNGRVCVLLVDSETMRFIANCLLPMGLEPLAPSQQPKALTQAPAPFNFGNSSTPNVRDKVTWDPTRHGWKLSVKKPKINPLQPFVDDSGHSLCVDLGLDLSEYASQKAKLYISALVAWNAIDGSARPRISIPNPA